jgi:arylsulfatase A-like enzyme
MLVSVDTLRADAVTPEQTPQLLAAFTGGWILDDLYSSAPWTLPAHASLLFSRFPAEHGARLPDQRVTAAEPSLAQAMASLGYITLAVVEGNYVSARHGLDQGFDLFLEHPPNIAAQDPREASVLEANLAWLSPLLQGLGSAKVFIFWHTYEIHCPYLPHGALADPTGLGQTARLLALESAVGRPAEGRPAPSSSAAISEQECQLLRQLYLGELAYLDAKVGPFLAELPKDWLVALTSDHGEEFCEHGGLLHADTLYEEVMRIPLLLRGPGLPPQPGPSRSLLDIAPTLLALVGEPAPASWQGHTLTGPQSTPLLMESFFLGPHIPAEDPSLLGLRLDFDKLIQSRNYGRYQAELYDLAADPGETNNLAAARIALRDHLYQILEAYALRNKHGEAATPLTPEERQLLESLGYLLPGSDP